MSAIDKPVILHQGVYKKTATVAEAVFIITGMTIGAGILGIPYVVAQVGFWVGLGYILVLGLIMLHLNLMVGEIALHTKENFQLPGLAGRYLGPWAKNFLSVVMIFGGTGALLAYTVGEGDILSNLFGGDSLAWGTIFWALGSLVVWRGLQAAKKVDRWLSLLVILIILFLAGLVLPHFNSAVVTPYNPLNIFLPFGVILFALNATPAIAEAHALLPGSQRRFKRALILGTLIPVVVYIVFAYAVVGAMGGSVTEIATIGLGRQFGPVVFWVGNLLAALAMATGYIGLGIAVKQSLVWDNKLNPFVATLFVIVIPISLFFFGVRSFVLVLDVVGGIFVGGGSIMMALIYARARKFGDLPAERYNFHSGRLIIGVMLAIFSLATVLSVMKLIGY